MSKWQRWLILLISMYSGKMNNNIEIIWWKKKKKNSSSSRWTKNCAKDNHGDCLHLYWYYITISKSLIILMIISNNWSSPSLIPNYHWAIQQKKFQSLFDIILAIIYFPTYIYNISTLTPCDFNRDISISSILTHHLMVAIFLSFLHLV